MSNHEEEYISSDEECDDDRLERAEPSQPSQPAYDYPMPPLSAAIGFGNNHLPISVTVQNYNTLPLSEQEQLWSTYPRIPQPEKLTVDLFPHQLVSVYKMEDLEHRRKIKKNDTTYYMTDFGVLGDIPGYGKSFSVVAHILRDKMPWDVTKPNDRSDIYTYNSCLKVISSSSKKRIRPNLLLCSPTLVEQWKEYFSFVESGTLTITEISAKKDVREDIRETVEQSDVVICSSTRYNDLITLMGNVVWKRFIFDEAGSTHIPSMRTIQAGFVWFVSATYMQMFRTVGSGHHYMRTFFDHIEYDMLEYFVIKNPVNFVKHSFKMPEVYHNTYLCMNPRMLNLVSGYIDQESRMMISAGDIKGALVRLGGGSTATETNLFEIVAKRQREKLDAAIFSINFWKQRGATCVKEVEMWEKKAASIRQIITELEEKYKNVLKDDCTICYSEISNPVLLPCCQNVFCGSCIMTWMDTKKTCPMCRALINLKEIVYIDMSSSSSSGTSNDGNDTKPTASVAAAAVVGPKTKPKTVLDIVSKLRDANGNRKKYLIFSMYDESFSTIRRELEDHHMNYVEISGSKATRDAKLRRFKEDKVDIVFLNSRFNGAGINLQMTTDIIMYHEMPPTIEEQVIGRALRIGRKHDLNIHHLCLEN
jgi:SNF2 family DNA or RNA helicase